MIPYMFAYSSRSSPLKLLDRIEGQMLYGIMLFVRVAQTYFWSVLVDLPAFFG